MTAILPTLELPTLDISSAIAFELPSDFKWLQAACFSAPNNKNDENQNDEEQEEQEPSSPVALSEQLQLPELISIFECEECSGFGSDLLWGYTVPVSSSTSNKNAGGNKSSSSPGKDSGAAGSSYSHYQQGGKKKGAVPQGKPSGGAKGELPSNAQGQTIINLTAEDYETDWYAILAIDDEGCNEDKLKSQFRRRCLETHPDKKKGKDDEFKQVQRAFEILSNPDARRQFDSARTFDDSIPPEGMEFDEKPADFFELYKPVFQRNARWSTVPVTVTMGDEKTPVADVRKFYDFWLGFRSWRDFSHAAELEEIHEGMPRYEKRFYQQENERILNGLKKQEAKRIRTLVDRAMESDPRLRAEARRIEAERVAAQEAKKEAQRQAMLEKERLENEAKEKELAAEREAQEAVARARQAWKDAKSSVVDTLKAKGLIDTESASKALPENIVNIQVVDWVFSKIPKEKDPIAVAKKILEPADDALVSGFNKMVAALEKSIGMTRYGEPVKKETAKEKEEKEAQQAQQQQKGKELTKVVWEEEDIINLTKAIAKFPGGTVDRWRRIAVTLREKFTEEQILVKTKQLESTAKNVGAEAALATVTNASSAAAASSSSAADNSATAAGDGIDDWTTKQQGELEEGLRATKDYKEKDKWIKVAGYVTGKTAKQCFERYKYLCSVTKKSK
jgi:DnaJ family protein C protein 2